MKPNIAHAPPKIAPGTRLFRELIRSNSRTVVVQVQDGLFCWRQSESNLNLQLNLNEIESNPRQKSKTSLRKLLLSDCLYIVVMTDIAEAMADKPDPFGVNVAYDPRDASKVLIQKQ